MMQSRQATFAVLRRLALQQHPRLLSALPKWNKVAPRPSYICATPLHTKSEPAQIRPQPSPPQVEAQVSESRVPKEQPTYEMTFTCKPCGTRSTHRISKQGYHFGSVLITCPECRNRHIISDHLNIFVDKATTIEDLMREKGQLVKKGTLSEDGNLEFWEDGTTTTRARNGDTPA